MGRRIMELQEFWKDIMDIARRVKKVECFDEVKAWFISYECVFLRPNSKCGFYLGKIDRYDEIHFKFYKNLLINSPYTTPLKPAYRSFLDKLICEHINNMKYTDFLSTPYWKIASGIAKNIHWKCQVCNSTKKLRTHHRTYERHGYEHYLEVIKEDLTVLCDECHKKFHNITEENNEQ